jgi:signal transduction histidine kinase
MRAAVAVLAVPVVLLTPRALLALAEHPVSAIGWLFVVSLASCMRLVLSSRQRLEVSLRGPVSIASVLVLDPMLALVINLLALVSPRELRERVKPRMVLYNHLHYGLTIYGAGLVAQRLPLNLVGQTIVAALLFHVGNVVATSLAIWLLGRGGPLDGVRSFHAPFPKFAVDYLSVTLLALLVVVLHEDAGPWSLSLLALPLWLGYNALQSAKAARERADELAQRVQELEVMHDLGNQLISIGDVGRVATLLKESLQRVGDLSPDEVVVALDGELLGHMEALPLGDTRARAGVPADMDPQRRAEVETVCSAVGLALQRMEVEEELRESQRAQAALAEGILTEGTAARSRVALHVHDEVLPYLAAAQIQADNVTAAVETGNTQLTTKLAGKVRDGVSEGIRALREVLDDLRRQTIVPGDLVPFVRRAAEEARVEHGLQVRLDIGGYSGGLSHPVEILVTETVTGLLNNVVKHAQASEVTISLQSQPGLVVAEVRDDGVGFDPSSVGKSHHGLDLMRQRAMIAHGLFLLESQPGAGTRVHMRLPSGTASKPVVLGRPPVEPAVVPNPEAVVTRH